MAEIDLPSPSPWSGRSYRNIATCDPSQDLYDDLVDPEDFDLLFEIEKRTQGIDQAQPNRHRLFQYGEIDRSTVCFERFFGWGRFSDGSFGVWYGALDEQTSIWETSHFRPEIDANDFANANGPIIQCRRLFQAELEAGSVVDLMPRSDLHPLLVSEDYSFCQRLGARALGERIEMFLTPSARNRGGICTPVLWRSVVTDDKALRTYLVIYPRFGYPPKFAPVVDDI